MELSNSEIRTIEKLLEFRIYKWKQYDKDLKKGIDKTKTENIKESLYKLERIINSLECTHKKFKEAYNESKINNG